MLKLSSSSHWNAEIPPLGFGCCPMGGHGWGRVNEDELRQAVAAALDLGIRLFDTSDIYGLGASETLLGQELKGQHDRAVIATKFGVRHENGRTFYDTSPAWIMEAAEGSLRRLGIDCLDLYQMHYWDGITPIDEIAATLDSLLASGKVRAYGITNYDPQTPAWNRRSSRLASYSYHYSLVHRQYEQQILAAQKNPELIFLSWGSLGQGVLSGNYHSIAQLDPADRRQKDAYANFHGAKFAAIQKLLAEMKIIASAAGIPHLTQLALRWIIDRFPRAVPLVGIKRPEQIIDAASTLNFKLDPAICERLDNLTVQFKTPTINS